MKTEASRTFQSNEVNYSYPPQRLIVITPQLQALKGEYKPLDVSLDLEGTDDVRRFTLTNPTLAPGAETPLSPHRQISTEPSKSELCRTGGSEMEEHLILLTLQVIFLSGVLM